MIPKERVDILEKLYIRIGCFPKEEVLEAIRAAVAEESMKFFEFLNGLEDLVAEERKRIAQVIEDEYFPGTKEECEAFDADLERQSVTLKKLEAMLEIPARKP
jgi:hypothetical protein